MLHFFIFLVHDCLCCIMFSYCVHVGLLCIFVVFFLVLILFFSTNREIGWEDHLQNGLFCAEWNVKP